MRFKSHFILLLFVTLTSGLFAGGESEVSLYPNGNTRHELTGLKGQLVRIVSYYPNGDLKEVGHYKNGVRHGSFVSYDQNGIKNCTAYFFSDKKDGVWSFYNAEGELVRTVFFNQNEIIRANPFQVQMDSEFK